MENNVKDICLHRGKTKITNEWVVGFLFVTLKGEYKITRWDSLFGSSVTITAEVYPETVGQCTGFHDSTKWEELTQTEKQTFLHQPDGWGNKPNAWNGKQIFQGDILEFPDIGEEGHEHKEGFDFVNRAAVVWNNGRWELDQFRDANSGVLEDMKNGSHEEFVLIFGESKIVGNIHDYPNLLVDNTTCVRGCDGVCFACDRACADRLVY